MSTETDGPGVDALLARAYRHPGIAERVVVRLIPAALGEAEDLAAEILGFARTDEPIVVGTATAQALGFPAWALVHDPANGRHALAIVRQLERLAKVAQSRPGFADVGFQELAAQLAAAAPHFLPTFWEEAGRAFLAAENGTRAGACFGRARAAERDYALPIDEDRVAAVYLEFAFGRGLSGKSMTGYGRELAARLLAADAYERFRTVAVGRTVGGLPPHVGLLEDIARMARAAKLKPDVEVGRFVREVLAQPSVARASWGFWRAAAPALIGMAATDSWVREQLVKMLPPSEGREDVTDEWVGLLLAAGVDALIVDPARSTGVRWLERLAAHRRSHAPRRSAALLGLVERAVPALLRAGRPLQLGPISSIDPDLLDACVAAGVPVAVDGADRPLPIGRWAFDDRPGRRELAAIAAAPELRQPLAAGVLETVGSRPELVPVLLTAGGARSVLAEWVSDVAAAIDEETVFGLAVAVRRMAPLMTAAGVAIAPDAFGRLSRADLSRILTTTLRAGVLAELAWPPYDAARTAITSRQLHRDVVSWPYVVVNTTQDATVIGPDGLVRTHTFAHGPAHPAPWTQVIARYIDDELLMTWFEDEARGYWERHPREVFSVSGWARFSAATDHETGLAVPGGGWTIGGQPLRPGDPVDLASVPVVSDGTVFWRLNNDRWQEFDPATGAGGRFSVPAFLDVDAVIARQSRLMPSPYDESPLGWADGLAGWRVRIDDDALVGEGIDGRSVRWTRPLRDGELIGALLMPGGAEPLPVTAGPNGKHVWTADGRALVEISAWTMPPFELWHALRPADPVGSTALRSIERSGSSRLLAGEPLGTVLPEVTATGVRDGIREWVAITASAAEELRRVADLVAPAGVDGPGAAEPVDAAALTAAMTSVSPRAGASISRYGARPADVARFIGHIGRALRGDPSATPANGSSAAAQPYWAQTTLGWSTALRFPRATAFRMAHSATPDAERGAMLVVLEALLDAGLLGDPLLRVCHLRCSPGAPHPEVGSAVHVGAHRVGVVVQRYYDYNYTTGAREQSDLFVERAADGVFGPVPGCTVADEWRPEQWPAELARAVCDRVRAVGAAPPRPDAVRQLAAAGVPAGQAALLLGGLPSLRAYTPLPTETRRALGLSAAEAKGALAALLAMDADTLTGLLGAALPADPARLWTDGPDHAAVAALWRAAPAPLSDVDDDALAAAMRGAALQYGEGDIVAVARGFADPTRWDLGEFSLDRPGRVGSVANALLWFAYERPVGDALRGKLPAAHRAVVAALLEPTFALPIGGDMSRWPALPAVEVLSQAQGRLYPSRLTGPDDLALSLGYVDGLGALLWGGLPALMAEIEAGGEAGPWPQNPLVTVPALVTEAADRYGLTVPAAAYYLQLLALPEPSDKRILSWNGWSSTQLAAARRAVVAAGLAVEAKRSRAGRTAFLPGAWLTPPASRPPIEAWKAPLFDLDDRGTPKRFALLVPGPVPALYHRAWQRVVDGDRPHFETLPGGGAGPVPGSAAR